jgi:hypothetical protein
VPPRHRHHRGDPPRGVASLWFASVEQAVEAGERTPGTTATVGAPGSAVVTSSSARPPALSGASHRTAPAERRARGPRPTPPRGPRRWTWPGSTRSCRSRARSRPPPRARRRRPLGNHRRRPGAPSTLRFAGVGVAGRAGIAGRYQRSVTAWTVGLGGMWRGSRTEKFVSWRFGTHRVHGSQRLGASARQRAGTPRQPRAPRAASGRVITGGCTPEADPPTGDHARVRPRVLPAHDRAVLAASAGQSRALRHLLRQQTGVENRVLGSRHHEAAQVRYLSNRPPTHAISERPSARTR